MHGALQQHCIAQLQGYCAVCFLRPHVLALRTESLDLHCECNQVTDSAQTAAAARGKLMGSWLVTL